MTVGNLPSKKGSSAFGDILGHGVPMADEEAVMGHMDTFCSRIRQFIEVINTMSQYSRYVHVICAYINLGGCNGFNTSCDGRVYVVKL